MSKSSRKNYPDGIDPKSWDSGHENDVRIGALEKDGDQLLKVLEDGNMVAVLSGMEIMYVFIYRDQ